MGFTALEIRDYIQRAVHQRSGDNLERARAAFRGLSPAEMAKEYGQSGQTRQQILDGYEQERALATAAMRMVCENLEG